jgi:hypothetical protein
MDSGMRVQVSAASRSLRRLIDPHKNDVDICVEEHGECALRLRVAAEQVMDASRDSGGSFECARLVRSSSPTVRDHALEEASAT